MNFSEFSVSTTNIFPLANSVAGGQLLSEYNLRSRETVATDPSIQYPIGQSFTHSMDDFSLSGQGDGADVNSTTIQINPGRAIVNGHYVELLAPITIDLAAANLRAHKEGLPELKGDLAIGLVMVYSTYATLAASAKPENSDGYYDGVQVVIVPETSVRRPIDVPLEHQYNEVNMHLLLGTFSYAGGRITSINQDANKVKMIDASRIGDLSTSLSDVYLSKKDLNPHHLYVFSGKGKNDLNQDTWCLADDSLMLWDYPPQMTTDRPVGGIAHFEYDPLSKQTLLVVPHKQIDGAVDQQGNPVYFPDKEYVLPTATFDSNSGGVVNSDYTGRILSISNRLNDIFRFPSGKLRKYLPTLTKDPANKSEYGKDGALPIIPVVAVTTEPAIHRMIADIRTILNTLINDVERTRSRCGTISQMPQTNPELQNLIDTTFVASFFDMFTFVSASLDNCVININTIQDATDPTQIYELIDTIDESLFECQNTIREIALILNSTSVQVRYINPSNATLPIFNECLNLLSVSNTNIKNAIIKLDDLDEAVRRNEAAENNVQITDVWEPGDYVLVGQDETQSATEGSYPSTIYMVDIGYIQTIKFAGNLIKTFNPTSDTYLRDLDIWNHTVVSSLGGGVELDRLTFVKSEDTPLPGQPNVNIFFQNSQRVIDYTTYKGVPNKDYFVVVTVDPISDTVEKRNAYFYTPTSTTITTDYILPPIRVTGGMTLATEEGVGGFYDVPDDATGQGYVALDEEGHLRVVDFNLLLMGIEAQQLGQDITELGSGLDSDSINEYLDEYVNGRICYPNNTQIKNCLETGADPHIIHLYLTLPNTTDANTIEIHDIGSRANSYLYVHIQGSATSATTLIFRNCDKLRIDDTIQGQPTIGLDNVNLYYSSNVLDRTSLISDISATGIRNLSLWYEQDVDDVSSPNLQVNGMTVTLVGTINGYDSIDPWDEHNPNDNHYSYALRSITFASDGTVINFGLIVGDSSTRNVDVIQHSLFRATFSLPQGYGLTYPVTKMTHKLKVSGSFTSCYYSNTANKYVVKDTNFSAVTQQYQNASYMVDGSIAFCTDSYYVSHITGVADTEEVDVWNLNTPHLFFGGAIE